MWSSWLVEKDTGAALWLGTEKSFIFIHSLHFTYSLMSWRLIHTACVCARAWWERPSTWIATHFDSQPQRFARLKALECMRVRPRRVMDNDDGGGGGDPPEPLPPSSFDVTHNQAARLEAAVAVARDVTSSGGREGGGRWGRQGV